MASVAMLTAVSKPNVKSVPDRSLSIVFGTPTTLTPRSASLVATPRVSSPPIATRASTPCSARLSLIRSTPPSILNGLVREEPRIVPPRGRMPRHCVDAQRHGHALERAAPAVAEADEVEAVLLHALADDGPDDGVQAGAVAATGEYSDAHVCLPRSSGLDRSHPTATPAPPSSRPSLGAPMSASSPSSRDDGRDRPRGHRARSPRRATRSSSEHFPNPAGWSTPPRRSGRRPSRPPGSCPPRGTAPRATSPASASPTSARPCCSGTARRSAPRAAPSCGRTSHRRHLRAVGSGPRGRVTELTGLPLEPGSPAPAPLAGRERAEHLGPGGGRPLRDRRRSTPT